MNIGYLLLASYICLVIPVITSYVISRNDEDRACSNLAAWGLGIFLGASVFFIGLPHTV